VALIQSRLDAVASIRHVELSDFLMKLSALHLRTHIALQVLLILITATWGMTYFLAHHLRRDMIVLLESQQLASADDIANSIDEELQFRIRMLEATASRMTTEMISHPEQLKQYLKSNPDLIIPFGIGVIVISNEGKGIVDHPHQVGHLGDTFIGHEYFKQVISTNKPYVGTPRIGRYSKKPEVGFAVPIFDKTGKRISVLVAYSELSDSDLLGPVIKSVEGEFKDRILLFSARDRMIITGTDPTRTLTPAPPLGNNLLLDRFLDGFEGSGITNNLRGVELFASAKSIPTAGWVVRVGVPTKIAFAPIRQMEKMAYSIASVVTILVGVLIWFVIKHSMSPLYEASVQITRMTKNKAHMEHLPIRRNDEIGQLIACFNSLVTERKSLEATLAHKANIDFLTMTNNRGHFMEIAEAELNRAKRYDKDLSIVMLDIDNFKHINDSRGHKSGDAVLVKLVEVCVQMLRRVDTLGRIGGEEFAILLPETPKEEAVEVAERIRTALSSVKVSVDQGRPIDFTVSIGVANLCDKDDEVDDLLNHADKALYDSKQSGKNRVSVAIQ
jgi:diguanylate cyclase (GGDEF)-like protein